MMLPFPGFPEAAWRRRRRRCTVVSGLWSQLVAAAARRQQAVSEWAFAPPGCYRAWPPLRPTDVAGLPCAGSVCAAGRRPGAPATARVSVPRRPLTPRRPWGLKTRPGLEPVPASGSTPPCPSPTKEPSFFGLRLRSSGYPPCGGPQASLIWCRVHFCRWLPRELGAVRGPGGIHGKTDYLLQMKRYVSILVHGGDGLPPPRVSRKLLTPSSRVF